MSEEQAVEIIEMISNHWQRRIDGSRKLWVEFLVTQDAELATLAVAKLAATDGDMPQIKDMREMLGVVTPETPPLERAVCPTCHDDMIVLVQTRPAVASLWMKERGLEATGDHDEVMPCPDCNSEASIGFRTSRSRTPDEATVRMQMEPLGSHPDAPATQEVPLWVRRWHYARHVKTPPDMRRFAEQGIHGDQSEPLMPDDAYLTEALATDPREIRAAAGLRDL